jgi:NAD(P)-dependent dehydrogenase (short-subunit alcohol dehydrogenase family)
MSLDNIHATRHEGRVAVVTGGASGIGRATVLRLVAEGASVLACDVNEAGLAETRDLAGRERIAVETADVTDNDDVDRVVRAAIAAFGRVDVVANVAGVMDNMLAPHELDDRTWERVMRVNVDGPMRLSRAVLRHLMERGGGGSIVNIASEAALRGGAAGFAYTTSKHAVIGQTRSIAALYARDGIRCNAVLPGGVATNIGSTMDAMSTWTLDRIAPVIGQTSIAEPDAIASLVSWLASDEASNVTGALVTSDGGWAAA